MVTYTLLMGIFAENSLTPIRMTLPQRYKTGSVATVKTIFIVHLKE
ncbi:hypothetical protein PDJ85_08975 [Bacillus cereus group sp. TH260-2LC]|nr:hypothetical protein [Bacillus thuringiensis]MDA1528496.1 hypothetical protein [Bacillus cereus group sp. TH260-2LC]